MHRQFFASDLDSGDIHRIDADGNILDSFDHGLNALSTPVPDDGETADIGSPDFDTEDPATWGLTQPERRVWALAYHSGRLYYSVWAGFEVWSVGLTETGEFAGDPRLEVTLPATPKAYPISDLAFDAAGSLLVAQRADIRSRYDYSAFTLAGAARTLRFLAETHADLDLPSAWNPIPQEYAVGLGTGFANGAGGLALGPGYNDDGTLATERCDATLWTTVSASSEGGGGDVQVSAADSVRTGNAGPTAATFLLYRDKHSAHLGGVGDVAVLSPCVETIATGETAPEPDVAETDTGTPPSPPPPPPTEGGYTADAPDLSVTAIAAMTACKEGAPCEFRIIIANEGLAPYVGPIYFRDTMSVAASFAGSDPAPWSCQDGGQVSCRHPAVTLEPGQSKQLTLVMTLGNAGKSVAQNCAALDWNPQSLTARNWAVQNALADIGYDPGAIDGAFSAATTSAIQEFRAATGLPPGGTIDDDLLQALFGQWGVGDEIAANDKACDTVRILDAPPPPPLCAAPKVLIAGACVELPTFCYGGRVWDADAAHCACPVTRPFWDAAARQCDVFVPPQLCSSERFWNGTKCVCPASRPFWNSRRQACVSFTAAQVCKGGRLWDGRIRQCICPAHKPHWNAARKECQALKVCRGDQVWDPVGKFCTCPPSRPFWAKDLRRCVRIDVTPQPTCRGNRVYSRGKNACVCPADKPFWVPALKSCVALDPGPLECKNGMVFDTIRKECVCPRGSAFDAAQKRCVRTGGPPQCTGGMILDKAKKACVCPPGANLNAARNKCVRPEPPPPACIGGRIFDRDIGDCVCPSGMILDTAQNCCERPAPTCRSGKVRQGSQCVCPAGRREVNGVCVRARETTTGTQCGRGQIRISGKCQCPGGQIYSKIRRRCSRINLRVEPDQMAPGFTRPCPQGTEFRRGRCRLPRGQKVQPQPQPLIP